MSAALMLPAMTALLLGPSLPSFLMFFLLGQDQQQPTGKILWIKLSLHTLGRGLARPPKSSRDSALLRPRVTHLELHSLVTER